MHTFGWKRGLPSRRFPMLRLAGDQMVALRPAVDLKNTGFLPEIWDQGQTSSCTGHGTARALMFARAKAKMPFVDLSRLFPYYNARVVEGSPSEDSGAAIGDVFAASQKFGDCPYSDLPTSAALVTARPNAAAYEDALKHKALKVTRVMGATPASLEYHIKHCVDVLGIPVVIGISVYESMESEAVAKSGIVPYPAVGEQMLGGHCIALTGYDDVSRLFTCDNSWSAEWGIGGRFKIPYNYVSDPDLADDFHAVLLDS